MNISRSTFQRILASARQKLADVLLSGKAIRIKGGNFEISIRRFRCASGHEWNLPLEELEGNPPLKCPVCDTPNISPVSLCDTACTGKGWGHRKYPGWSNPSHHLEDLPSILPTGEKLPNVQ